MDNEFLKSIPVLPQRQDSTSKQLSDLIMVANRLGMYDAADAIKMVIKNIPEPKWGCHCDLEPHMQPDGCVIDTNSYNDCIYAKKGMRKEQCEYWQKIKE
jgi:hypothetical protein